MKRAIFLWGASGAGKSAVVRQLLGAHVRSGVWSVGAKYAAVGAYRGCAVEGADCVPRDLRTWFACAPDRDLLLDGHKFDREALALLHGRFVRIGVLLDAPARVLAARRAGRGSPDIAPETLAKQTARFRLMLRDCDRSLAIDSAGLSIDAIARKVGAA